MLYRAIRPILFRLDAERAHDLVFTMLVAGERLLAASPGAARAWSDPAVRQTLWGLEFPNPVGLAAGFDKDARAPHIWPLFGFGFAELGTVTAEPQPGNPQPRLFRLPRDRALINRFGFNNSGATAVAQRLQSLFRSGTPPVPIGINLGKSKVTPLEEAPADYLRSFRQLFPFASYVVLNVSSPNTPGLRQLQEAAQLDLLLEALANENAELARRHGATPKPLLIKVAPDLSEDALAQVVTVARRQRAAGLVATNTTVERDGLHTVTAETGGLSGAPLRDRATAVIRTLHRLAPELPIIGVGGIFSAVDAYEKIRAGASLVQIYTGMIFEGPRLPYRIARGLVDLLRRDGFTHLREAVGTDA